jgi:FMN-dependent oxidoreductase (nitrilotriacetate monooxygenase family)
MNEVDSHPVGPKGASAMSDPKRLILNLFEMNCVSHITHGLWRLPGNSRTRFNDIEYWTELAQLLEAGGFDAVFLADVIGAYDVFRGGPETAIREGLQIPSNDPMLVVPAMAAVTKNLGFGITFSTTYEPPFAFARRMSTLDHLTKGRVGWNIVTSYLPNAARNFGLTGEVDHDTRYEIADEYLDVLYKLWEGSWDDDAVIEDRENNIYADPSKVRYIDHEGPRFSVAGPHLSSPSTQRTPFLIQATQSARGIEFAGRHASGMSWNGRAARGMPSSSSSVRRSSWARHARQRRRSCESTTSTPASMVYSRTRVCPSTRPRTMATSHSVRRCGAKDAVTTCRRPSFLRSSRSRSS